MLRKRPPMFPQLPRALWDDCMVSSALVLTLLLLLVVKSSSVMGALSLYYDIWICNFISISSSMNLAMYATLTNNKLPSWSFACFYIAFPSIAFPSHLNFSFNTLVVGIHYLFKCSITLYLRRILCLILQSITIFCI
jgi:hypothetical protein